MAETINGLEQLRTFLKGRRDRHGIAKTLEFDLIEVEEGRVVFEAFPGLHVYNPIGCAHGGYASTLLDSACGCAVQSKLGPEQSYSTLELKVAFHRRITTETGRLIAEGKIVSWGRRAAFAEGRLIDELGGLLASATSTLQITEGRATGTGEIPK